MRSSNWHAAHPKTAGSSWAHSGGHQRTKAGLVSKVRGATASELRQQAAIRELSTPVLQPRDRLLLVPLIRVIDTERATQLTDNLLRAIGSTRAKVVVMDITGVANIDADVAQRLSRTVQAARVMGAVVIVTGMSTKVANALVEQGLDLGSFKSFGNLQAGIDSAEHWLGYKLARVGASAPLPALH